MNPLLSQMLGESASVEIQARTVWIFTLLRQNAEGGPRLADDVLAQNGAERGATVAHARERGPARALELDVTAHPISVVHLAKQHRTAVAKLRQLTAPAHAP
jgi:hypothetical protein